MSAPYENASESRLAHDTGHGNEQGNPSAITRTPAHSPSLADQVLALATGKTQQEIAAACTGARPNHAHQTRCWREMDSNLRFLVARPAKLSWEAGLLSRKRERICWGTEGSNPVPSCKESPVRDKSHP
jgi:hypothetical protein